MASPNQINTETNKPDLPIIIELSENGIININSKEVKLNELSEIINEKLNNKKDNKVVVSTPNETKVNVLIKVVDTIRSLGIENIALITKEKK